MFSQFHVVTELFSFYSAISISTKIWFNSSCLLLSNLETSLCIFYVSIFNKNVTSNRKSEDSEEEVDWEDVEDWKDDAEWEGWRLGGGEEETRNIVELLGFEKELEDRNIFEVMATLNEDDEEHYYF